MSVKIIYESDDYVVVDKPYDMYINSDVKEEKNTVAYQIGCHDSHRASSTQPLHFVQRLDYATSGVMLIAKHRYAAANSGRLFERRLVNKYYMAVVRGCVKDKVVDIHYEVGEDLSTARSNHKMVAVTGHSVDETCSRPRPAETRLLVLESGVYDGDPATVLLLKPKTGRRHQLRVHCAAVGHPIVGDYTYSDGQDRATHRMFLHATRLVIPLERDPLDIYTDIPFYNDEQFTCRWKSGHKVHEYKSREDFLSLCSYIDNINVNIVKSKEGS